jgi:hypothetical protein
MAHRSGAWRLVVAGLALAISQLATAVSGRADETLKFISFHKDEKGLGDWFLAIIKEFETTHPGVKIEFTKVEAPAYAETMTTLFAAGSPPDIVQLPAFDYPKFAANGWLENLDPYIAKAKLDLSGCKAGVERIPVGLEVEHNQFSKMVMEEAQRMIINDLDPAAAAAVMQKRGVAIQQGG